MVFIRLASPDKHHFFYKKDYRCMAELKNIRIAVSGAPEWVEEKRLYKVYRPAPVLAAACKKFASLPLTHHHPKTPVDGQNFRNIAIGWTGESPEVDYIAETDEVGI